MIFNSLIKPKATLTTLPETATLDEALTVLEDTGYRCVPVLDKSGKIFREIFIRCIFTGIKHDRGICIYR